MRKHGLLIVFSLLFCISSLKAEYFTITRFSVNVTITEEGYADFDEVIEVEFSQPRHGIFQFIPYRNMIDGKQVDYIFKDIRVEGFKFSKSKENNNLVLKIGDADTYVEGRQVYKIHFRVLNPIHFFEDHAEFYWDILGQSWPVTSENFSFDVMFPDKMKPDEQRTFVYMGEEGSTDTMAFQVSGQHIFGASPRPLLAGEGVTIATYIPKDVFQPMDAMTSLWMKHALVLPAILFVIIGFIAKFMARNRRQTIMTEYFPPAGVSPVIAGGFVDHSVDNNDVLSLIPHLANMGYLRMEATEGKGFFKKDSITFHKTKEAGADLMPFEKMFYDGLFSYGNVVPLDSLKDRFYTTMSLIKANVQGWIHDQGWYEKDQKAFGCVTGGLALVAIAWGAYAIFANQNMNGIALGLAGFILLFIANRFNKRSLAGNETYRKLEGFRQFVAKAERPVIERLMKEDPLYYDKTMPFALAFGYLKQWNKQFDGLLTQPPSWYTGPHMYAAGTMGSWNTFSESFPSEINDIGSVFSSSPSSSSSGGGGGGGFSGGGGGGGGGGSW